MKKTKKTKKKAKNAEMEITSKIEQEIMDFEEENNHPKINVDKKPKKSSEDIEEIPNIEEDKENDEKKGKDKSKTSKCSKIEIESKSRGKQYEERNVQDLQRVLEEGEQSLELKLKVSYLEEELSKYKTLKKTLKDSLKKKTQRIDEVEQQLACSYKRNEELEMALAERNVNVPSRMIMLNNTVPINRDKLEILKVSAQGKASQFVGGLAELVFGEDVLKTHSIPGKVNNKSKHPRKPSLDKTLLNAVYVGFLQWASERRLTAAQIQKEGKQFFCYINNKRTSLNRQDLPPEDRRPKVGVKRKNKEERNDSKKCRVVKKSAQDVTGIEDHHDSTFQYRTSILLIIESTTLTSSISADPDSYFDPSSSLQSHSSTVINENSHLTTLETHHPPSISQFSNLDHSQVPTQHSLHPLSSSKISTVAEIHQTPLLKPYSSSFQFTATDKIHHTSPSPIQNSQCPPTSPQITTHLSPFPNQHSPYDKNFSVYSTPSYPISYHSYSPVYASELPPVQTLQPIPLSHTSSLPQTNNSSPT